jgi:hypothetical protein
MAKLHELLAVQGYPNGPLGVGGFRVGGEA